MNKAILFTGVEDNKEIYQLIVGLNYIETERNLDNSNNLEYFLDKLSDDFAFLLAEESKKTNEAYTCLSGNGKKLILHKVTNKAEIVQINKLEDSVVNEIGAKISYKLNKLLDGKGFSIPAESS
jgi:hypothetical protein